jgi:hypothetical protein
MEKGYYKPEPEEFCSGFEFQRFRWRTDKQWANFQVSQSGIGIPKAIADLSNNIIRVKLLDRADIEAEGGKFVADEVSYFEFGSLKLFLFKNNPVISIDRISVGPNGYKSEHQVFRGTIRNRTELRKLLKQLGV